MCNNWLFKAYQKTIVFWDQMNTSSKWKFIQAKNTPEYISRFLFCFLGSTLCNGNSRNNIKNRNEMNHGNPGNNGNIDNYLTEKMGKNK